MPVRCASTSSTTGAGRATTALGAPQDLRGASATASEPDEHLDWPVERRLEQRIIDGNRNGLEADLDQAMADGHEPWPS